MTKPCCERAFGRESRPTQSWWLAVCVLVIGCTRSGGQTGDEGAEQDSEVPGGPNDRACDSVERAVDADATTAYGIGIEQLIEGFARIEDVPFFWMDYDWWDGQFAVLPGAGETRLEVEVALAPGMILERRDKPFEGQPSFLPCDGVHYEIPVTLRLATADGGLRETVRAQLRASSSRVAFIQLVLDLQAISGSFGFESDEYTIESGKLLVSIVLFPGGSLGRIEPELDAYRHGGIPATPSHSDAGALLPEPSPEAELAELTTITEPFEVERSRYIATWPSALSCHNGMPPISRDAQVLAESATDVVQIVDEASLVLDDASDDAFEIEVELLAEEVCVQIGSRGFSFPLIAELASEGHALEARMPLRVRANSDSMGSLEEISIEREDYGEPLSPLQLSTLLGFEVDGSQDFEQLILVLRGSLTRESEDWAARGTLRVHGLVPEGQCVASDSEDAGDDGRSNEGDAGCFPTELTLDDHGEPLLPGKPLLVLPWISR